MEEAELSLAGPRGLLWVLSGLSFTGVGRWGSVPLVPLWEAALVRLRQDEWHLCKLEFGRKLAGGPISLA